MRSSQSRSSSANELGDEEGEQEAERIGVQGRSSVLTGSVATDVPTSRSRCGRGSSNVSISRLSSARERAVTGESDGERDAARRGVEGIESRQTGLTVTSVTWLTSTKSTATLISIVERIASRLASTADDDVDGEARTDSVEGGDEGN